jgi:hypothetical protein
MLTRRELLIVLLSGLLAGQRPQIPHGGGEAPPEPGEAECRNPVAFYWCVQIYGMRCAQLSDVRLIAACMVCVYAGCYARWCL